MAVTQPVPTTCPRCSESIAEEAFYGICRGCREELRHRWSGAARDVAASEYEPKMNVTPNAVASKD